MFGSVSTGALRAVRNVFIVAPFQSLASFADMVLLVGVFVILALQLLDQSYNPIVRVFTDAVDPIRKIARRVAKRRLAVTSMSLRA